MTFRSRCNVLQATSFPSSSTDPGFLALDRLNTDADLAEGQ